LKTTTILVTGGAGNIGSALVRALSLRPNHVILVADNLSTGSIDKVPLSDNVHFHNIDVNEFAQVSPLFAKHKINYVFHFAAVVGVKRTLENPLSVLRDIKGIENLLELARANNISRFYYSSSSEVYGEPFEIPMNEHSTPLNSRLPYAIVKNVGEAFCRSYQQAYGLSYINYRFFNTYGPMQSDDFVVPRFLKKAMSNEDIVIFGDGNQTRTFCYVDDNIEACLRAHDTDLFKNETLNIGSDIEFTVNELADTIIKICNSTSKIIHAPALKEGDMNRRKPDISKMKELLGKSPRSLEEGLKLLIQHI